MNRLLLCIVFVAFAFIASIAQAGTESCFTKQRCPEGVKPGSCCKPPPCEFYEQLKSKRAMQRLFANKKTRARLKKQAGGDNAKAADLLYEFVKKKVEKMDRTSRCKVKSANFPPTFETNDECEITAKMDKGSKAMSKDGAHRDLNTCSEFIEAIYAHEQFHKDICFKTNSTERLNQALESYASEEVDGYQKEIDRLKADLQDFWRACSPTADSALSRKLAQEGISVLKKKTKQKKTPKAGG